MPESLILPAGMVVKVDERKFSLVDNFVVAGDVVPEKEKTQKTYLIKALCPTCNRIIRTTAKNWAQTDVRQNVECLHTDGTRHIMELADATEEPDYAG